MSKEFKAMKMAQEVDDAASALDQIKARLLAEIDSKRNDLQALSGKFEAGDDFEALAQTDAIATVDAAEIERDMQALREVEQALSRLEAGSYGLCEKCGEKMAAARLDVQPAARYCVTCQEAHEAGHAE